MMTVPLSIFPRTIVLQPSIPKKNWTHRQRNCQSFSVCRSCSPRSVDQLKKEISNLDAQFDGCQDVWSKGEAEGFFNEEFLVINGTFFGCVGVTCKIEITAFFSKDHLWAAMIFTCQIFALKLPCLKNHCFHHQVLQGSWRQNEDCNHGVWS